MDQLVADLIAEIGVPDALAYLETRRADCVTDDEAARCSDLIAAVRARGRH